MNLTRRQKEILEFVSEFIRIEGYSPSMEEIAGHFGFASLNGVFKHLASLESRGYLRREPNQARSIELSRTATQAGARELPLFGYVAAGKPIEAIPARNHINIPEELLKGRGPHYVLVVRGESMIDEHIQDGDFVIVEAREQADNGEMIVALVDGENVTLKKYYREGARIRLQPANPQIATIVLDETRVKVQGVVVGVIRKYA